MLTYPHCEARVLHAPGECEFCDLHPDWQELRETWSINFTGHYDADKILCPAEQARNLSNINGWGGNTARPGGRQVVIV